MYFCKMRSYKCISAIIDQIQWSLFSIVVFIYNLKKEYERKGGEGLGRNEEHLKTCLEYTCSIYIFENIYKTHT